MLRLDLDAIAGGPDDVILSDVVLVDAPELLPAAQPLHAASVLGLGDLSVDLLLVSLELDLINALVIVSPVLHPLVLFLFPELLFAQLAS